jgi:hypothetical protein
LLLLQPAAALVPVRLLHLLHLLLLLPDPPPVWGQQQPLVMLVTSQGCGLVLQPRRLGWWL